jgi:hypothetical protein
MHCHKAPKQQYRPPQQDDGNRNFEDNQHISSPLLTRAGGHSSRIFQQLNQPGSRELESWQTAAQNRGDDGQLKGKRSHFWVERRNAFKPFKVSGSELGAK